MPTALPFLLLQCRPDGPIARDEVACIARLGGLSVGTSLEPHLMLDEPEFDPAQLDLKGLYSGVIISGSPYSAGLLDDGHHNTPASPVPAAEELFSSEQVSDLERTDLDVDSQARAETPAEIAHLDRRVCALVRRLLDEDIPTLGLCYGLHHLALGAGGVLTTQTSEDLQAIDVTLTPEGVADPVTGQLDPVFSSYVGHSFSMADMPQGATLLATGPKARRQLVRFNRCAYGSQFHPEITADGIFLRVDLYRGTYFQEDEYEAVVKRVSGAHVESSSHLIAAFVRHFTRSEDLEEGAGLTEQRRQEGHEDALQFIPQQDRFVYAF